MPSYDPFTGRMVPTNYYDLYYRGLANPGPAPAAPTAPSPQVIRVNGAAGANALQLGPNASVIVADESNDNRLFLCMTDGAGFKTVRAMRCEFESAEPIQSDDRLQSLERRMTELEAKYNDRIAGTKRHEPAGE